MKVKNKKTGEIADIEINSHHLTIVYEDGRVEQFFFDSLKDLAEWEDYEEPKNPYFINWFGEQESNVTITVKDKERVVDRDGEGSRYLIWAEDETFENVDSLIKGKFNSSDLYGRLEKGKTYDCKVYGWRNGLFSWYRNIIECKEVENETEN